MNMRCRNAPGDVACGEADKRRWPVVRPPRSLGVTLGCFAALWVAGFVTSVSGQRELHVPRIWDDDALKDWVTPIAALKVRQGHYTAAEYYAVPADNLRTYPVYRPDKEPPGYWEALQTKKPEPLVDVSKIRTKADWIAAGARAFQEIDTPVSRTDDPALIAIARDPKMFENVPGLADGTVHDPRWVVTERGVMLSNLECASCHFRVTSERTIQHAAPAAIRPEGVGPVSLGLANRLLRLALTREFPNESVGGLAWRLWSVPWAPDARLDRLRTLDPEEAAQEVAKAAFNPHGVIPRENGSLFYGTRVPDLHLLRYNRYVDATGTHGLRGPEDVARYAALINSADPMDFGAHRFRADAQRRVLYRYADEVLYAIGMYLLSLEPPKNPNPPPADLVARGEQIFKREKCATCHPPPDYTTGELTPAEGFDPPADHPNRQDIRDRSVGTDSGLALKTRKGTGFYKIPSLRGLWYRPRLLHDASLASLEELFDSARLSPDYQSKGWSPPGVTRRAVPGLEFLVKLKPEEKAALIAFLRSL
jgi:hypothetical protein